MPCPHNKWSGQWYCPEMDEARKGRSRKRTKQGKDKPDGRSYLSEGQWTKEDI